jgi:hypothetical protein
MNNEPSGSPDHTETSPLGTVSIALPGFDPPKVGGGYPNLRFGFPPYPTIDDTITMDAVLNRSVANKRLAGRDLQPRRPPIRRQLKDSAARSDIDESLADARELLMGIHKLPGLNKDALARAIKSIDVVRADYKLPAISTPSDPWGTFANDQTANQLEQVKELREEIDKKLEDHLKVILNAVKDPRSSASASTYGVPPKTLASSRHAPPATYASVTAPQTGRQPTTAMPATTPRTVTGSHSKQAKQQTKKTTFRERRLIIEPATAIANLNAIETRNRVNDALRKAGVDKKILVAMVHLSKAGNVVLTTGNECMASDLLSHRMVWEELVHAKSVKKDQKWAKIIAHGIPTDIFPDTKEGMEELRSEIELFNSHVKLATAPHWLTKVETRAGKSHSSVLLAFETEAEARLATQHRLIVAATSVRTTRFIGVRPDMQCQQCQGLGHGTATCRRQPKCQLCADSHETRNHGCATCRTPIKGNACAHTIYKCANCGGPHRANDAGCETIQAVKSKKNTGDSMMDVQ